MAAALVALSLVVTSQVGGLDEPVDPRGYLYDNYAQPLAHRLDCVIFHESTWDQWARNGTHLGLAQFDYPTWLETPQGQAGWSRYDPIASIDALAWGWTNLGPQRWTTARYC